jgi:hypothetical protein
MWIYMLCCPWKRVALPTALGQLKLLDRVEVFVLFPGRA